MPTFYGRKTAVQLSVAELAKVITQSPIHRQCPQTTKSVDQIDLQFAEASTTGTLAEHALTGDDGRHLRFLGSKEDMPFLLVRAGRDFDANNTARGTQRPAKTFRQQKTDKPSVYDTDDDTESVFRKAQTTLTKPLALCVNVFLTASTFSHIAFEHGSRKTYNNDIKISVYVNGDFIESQIIGHKQFHSPTSRGMNARITRFTGQRISRMIVKPWVFAPRDRKSRTTHNGLDEHSRAEDGDSNPRWGTISRKFGAEAERDTLGDRPISADYLTSLATLPLPSDITDLERTDDATFGVVDVLIIRGDGQKDGPDSTYLTKPTKIRAHRHSADLSINSSETLSGGSIDRSVSIDHGCQGPSVTMQPPTLHRRPSDTPTPLASRVIRPLVKANAKPQAAPLILDGSADDPSQTHHLIRDLFPPARNHAVNSQSQRKPSASTTLSKPSRNRMHYHEVITTKQTLAEEYQSIAEQTIDEVQRRRRKAGSGVDRGEVSSSRGGVQQASGLASHLDTNDLGETSSLSSIPEESTEEVSLVEEPQELQQAKETMMLKLKMSPEKLQSAFSRHRSLLTRESKSGASGRSFRAGSIVGGTLAITPIPTRRHSQTSRSQSGATTPAASCRSSQTIQAFSPGETYTTPAPSRRNSHTDRLQSAVTTSAASRRSSQTVQGSSTGGTDTPSAPSRRHSQTSRSQSTATIPAASRRHSDATETSSMGNTEAREFDADFVVPELSRNCSITYAEPGVVRNVGAVRGGWFREEGMVMGVRFIVG